MTRFLSLFLLLSLTLARPAGAETPVASDPCPGAMAGFGRGVGSIDDEREAARRMRARPPLRTDAELRDHLRGLADQSLHTQHGRGRLPAHIDPAEAVRALQEMTRLVEADDYAGMAAFLANPETARRLGARFDFRPIEVDAVDLMLPRSGARPAPRRAEGDPVFLDWFVDHFIEVRHEGRRNAIYIATTDHADREVAAQWYRYNGIAVPVWRETHNSIVVPSTLHLRGLDTTTSIQSDMAALAADPVVRRMGLNEARLKTMARTVMLAQWEEVFHHVDWVVWTQTGRSVSPSVNRLYDRLGIEYQWWAHNELTPYIYGLRDSRVLVGGAEDAARSAAGTYYPQLRHLVGQSPVWDELRP